MTNSFKYFGLTMPVFTISYGSFLLLWGIIVSIVSNSQSITSWIPALLGGPICLMGILSLVKPGKVKIWSHLAVAIALIAFLGGFDFFRGISSEGGLFNNPMASISKIMLMITGGFYIFGCVRSFRFARKL
jgi:hypothetical protein